VGNEESKADIVAATPACPSLTDDGSEVNNHFIPWFLPQMPKQSDHETMMVDPPGE